ncbi:MAG: hypothetical protein LBJ61_12395 [Deltaproteobacteria bacterium]|nr:hypothetical protein [Deltaproteobacteria bacterium]
MRHCQDTNIVYRHSPEVLAETQTKAAEATPTGHAFPRRPGRHTSLAKRIRLPTHKPRRKRRPPGGRFSSPSSNGDISPPHPPPNHKPKNLHRASLPSRLTSRPHHEQTATFQ